MLIRTTTFFILALSLFFAGCDSIYRMLDKEGAEEKDLIGEVIPFEKNVQVEEVQALLALYGYNPGRVDGSLGTRTRNAIEKFQKDNGLKESRFIDQATFEAIVKHRRNGLVNDNNELNIHVVQQILDHVGLKPGKVDGKMGRKTKRAVKKFQKKHGLKVDGKIGYQTMNKLAEYILVE